MRSGVVFAAAVGCSTATLAHNVVGAVFTDRDRIEGEFGFSNGDLAPAGVPVELRTPDDRLIETTVTDAQGAFVFRVTEALAYRIVADLGQGHVGTVEVFAEDIRLPETAEQAVDAPEADSAEREVQTASPARLQFDAAALDAAALGAAVSRAVAAEIKPLRRELQAMQSATRLADILGGIGVIVGLCGAAAWWLGRRDQRDH